jgi:hypothetical protein
MVCAFAISFIYLAAYYSGSIYPALDSQYGGGKAGEMTIVMDDDRILIGRLFHYDEKRYYLMDENGVKTIFIDAAHIKSVKKM